MQFNSKGFVLEQPLERIKDIKGIHPPKSLFLFPFRVNQRAVTLT